MCFVLPVVRFLFRVFFEVIESTCLRLMRTIESPSNHLLKDMFRVNLRVRNTRYQQTFLSPFAKTLACVFYYLSRVHRMYQVKEVKKLLLLIDISL